jgi:Sec7-like guanine-nucleotide exchange factor
MEKKLPFILALVCALCFTTGLSAQDTTQKNTDKTVQKQDRKKKKGAGKQKTRLAKRAIKGLEAVELTEDQQKKLAGLVDENFKTLKSLQRKIDGFIDRDKRKTMNAAVKKARGEGVKWPEALKIAYEEIGLSAEDQESVQALNEERNTLFDNIKKEITDTFSDDQKKALAATKGKKAKRKGKEG